MVYLILALLLAHQAFVYKKNRRFDPFDLVVLVDIVIFLLFFYGIRTDPVIDRYAGHNPSYILTILAGIGALYVGLHWPRRQSSSRGPTGKAAQRNHKLAHLGWLWAGFGLYLLAACVVVAGELAYSGLSLIQSILGERLSDYLGGGILQPAFWSVVLIAGLAPSLMLLVDKLDRRRWFTAAGIYAALWGVGLATFHTRLGLILLLALPVVYFHFRVRRIPAPVLVSGSVLVLYSLTFLEGWRAMGLTSDWSRQLTREGILGELQQTLNPLRGFDEIMLKYEERSLKYELGETYFDILLTFIPRNLWRDKPITAFENRWTEKVTGLPIGSGVGVWTFTAWGEGLAQFGFAGMLLNLFLYGFLISRATGKIADKPVMLFVLFSYSVLMATFLRAGFQASAVYTINFIGPCLVCYYLAERRGARFRGKEQLVKDRPAPLRITSRIPRRGPVPGRHWEGRRSLETRRAKADPLGSAERRK
jgi:oligosaccharide repeat unit polymerase